MTTTLSSTEEAVRHAPHAAPGRLTARPRLADLLRPIDAGTFYVRHWKPSVPYLSTACGAFAESVRAEGPLASVDALLERYTGDVLLFGPGATRASVSAREAKEALEKGSNLYFPNVAGAFAGIEDFLHDVAVELGVAPWQITAEAFAGRAGGVSSRHYDHDTNFQILLAGEKEWELEPNEHIVNPLRSYHPLTVDTGRWSEFCEEAYASDRPLPAAFDRSKSWRLRAEPGSVLFLPRGCWHETRSVSDTWSLNLVVKGVTWADAIARSLVASMQAHGSFRAYCDGYRGRFMAPEHGVATQQTFESLRQDAIAALEALTLGDVELAPMGDKLCTWVEEASERAVVREQDGTWWFVAPPVLASPIPLKPLLVPVAKTLCAFERPFLFKHARHALPGASAEDIYNFIALLARRALVTVRSAK